MFASGIDNVLDYVINRLPPGNNQTIKQEQNNQTNIKTSKQSDRSMDCGVFVWLQGSSIDLPHINLATTQCNETIASYGLNTKPRLLCPSMVMSLLA
jgi:hypothetical protein